jgi:hypothetical protein
MTKALHQRPFGTPANDQQVFVASWDSSHEIDAPFAVILDHELPFFAT